MAEDKPKKKKLSKKEQFEATRTWLASHGCKPSDDRLNELFSKSDPTG